MSNYSSVAIDATVSHRSRWMDARNSNADFITIVVPAGLVGTLTVEGTSDTSTVLSELSSNPAYSDASAASASDVTSSCVFDGSLSVTSAITLHGSFSGASTFIAVRWSSTSGSGNIVIVCSDTANTGTPDPTVPDTATALTESRGIRIEKFAPNETLTTSNFEASFTAAMAWCRNQLSLNGSTAYHVVIPPGVWPITQQYAIDGTYATLGCPTPGIKGAGSNQTVLQLTAGLTDGTGVLDLGATTEVVDMVIEGIKLRCVNSGLGNGIVVHNSSRLTLRDVVVENFNAVQSPDSGWGIAFVYGLTNHQHQHPTLENVRVSVCQGGLKLWNIADLNARTINVDQCMWMSISWNRLLTAHFSGAGNVQGADVTTNSATAWYGRALHPEISTGWPYSTGLASGTTATLSTTTIAADSDTGIPGYGTCVLSGVTGMTLDSVGNWVQLTKSGGANYQTENVSGIYQIVGYNSPTSVTIAKGTNHATQTANVTWQVLGTEGGSQVQYDGYPYHEGNRRCLIFLGPDLVTSSQYNLSGVKGDNTMPLIAQQVGAVRLMSSGPAAGSYYARLAKVSKFTTDLDYHVLNMDSWSRQGCVARAAGLASLPLGNWEGARSVARRMNSFVTERGGFSFDPARQDKLTLSGTDITSVKSVQDDAVTLAPEFGGSKPTWVSSDAYFGGPCFNLVGGATGAVKNLIGTIAAAKLPASRFSPTLLVVARLPTTSVDAGQTRRIIARAADGSRDLDIGFNDGGAGFSGGNFFSMYSVDISGSGVAQIRSGVDVLPHAYALRWDMRGNGGVGAGLGVDEISAPTEYPLSNLTRAGSETWAAQDIQLWLMKDLGSTIASLYVRFVAVIPYALGAGEVDQFMDMAAAECGVVR